MVLLSPSAVHHSTTSVSPFIVYPIATLLRPSVTSSLKFANSAITIAAPRFGTNSRQYCDKYLTLQTHPKPHLLPSHQSTWPRVSAQELSRHRRTVFGWKV